MTQGARSHPDPNPVRPSQAEGEPDDLPDDVSDRRDEAYDFSRDPHTNRPSQAEGEDD
ncbi:hypothetical protein SAMN04488242_2646 [Tessaracoccus oleiagri]|uniref:Uncharacterized protein n=1 Tax=Tessaracoccus oleiagri TaxID=686624 RepID=A0A1G9MHW3_9ACTN|nr:hypothetical protein SAMN04488242_2646 [Tessaracoccus oleiagri]